MILTGSAIRREINNGGIEITPFDENKLNPNSYNLTLHPQFFAYKNKSLDMKEDNPTELIIIPKEGLILEPGQLYLGMTREHTSTYRHVPILEGRSSLARLGLSVHVTGGFGDIGFCGRWTLEISCILPVKIYPNIEVCQIYYMEPSGEIEETYEGKYQNSRLIEPSKIHEEF